MNLIHKQDIILIEIGQKGRQISRLLNGLAGGNADMDPHFVGDDPRQRGFAQSRGAMEEHMIQGFLAHFGRVNEYGQVFLGLFLANILCQALGTEGTLPLVLPQKGCGHKRGRLGLLLGKVDAHAALPPFT